jgi:predicted RNA binding protein YcfA (HicA-like mRNA interferase family)
MPKRYSSRHIIRTLETHGFVFVAQKGSHAKYRRASRTVIVPAGKGEIPLALLDLYCDKPGSPTKILTSE